MASPVTIKYKDGYWVQIKFGTSTMTNGPFATIDEAQQGAYEAIFQIKGKKDFEGILIGVYDQKGTLIESSRASTINRIH